MLKWLYHRNKEKFWDLMVADFYQDIPDAIKEPSIEFLSNARPALERFWSIQAYNIQRRAISDSKNAQVYQGFLLCIRTLLAVVSKQRPVVIQTGAVQTEQVPKNPNDLVDEFVRLAKDKNK